MTIDRFSVARNKYLLGVADSALSGLSCCLERERHVNGRCSDCPYNRRDIQCREYMLMDAIDIVRRFQATLKNEKEDAE